VTKLGHPLNTTKRLVVVVPPLIHRHPGFWEGVRTVKGIAGTLGATVLGLVVQADSARMAALFKQQKPDIPTTLESVAEWNELLPRLQQEVRPDDLIVVMSARYGTLPWHPKLERLPAQLGELAPESFIIMYPSEVEAARPVVTDIAMPRGLVPGRVVTDLPRMPFEQAMTRLLAEEFGADRPAHLRAITRTLVRAEEEFSTEVRPGVVVPHTRVEGLEETVLFLGISPEGIEFPRARQPAHLIFVLLSPLGRPQEHLRSLAEIAQLVSSEERLRELLEVRTVEMLPDWFHAAGV
jgi:mannitol/fructose-specific phosphotransferase system IIA component (Ntr-type)